MIIHKTIFKELLKNLSVIIISLSLLLFMERFVRLTRVLMGKGTDMTDLAKIFIYTQPSILLLSVPMGILIAVFLTYGRMAADSETVVLKASGMGFMDISKAAILLSSLCCIVLLFTSLYLLPKSMESLKYTIHETIVKKAAMTFEEETFSDVFKGTAIYIKNIPAENRFEGIFIYRNSDKSMEDPVVIVAENGIISSNPTEGMIKLSMNNGVIHTFKDGSSSTITFSAYDFILTSGAESAAKIKPVEINTLELWNERDNKPLWALELHKRFALPFACLIFGFLGAALSNRIGKIGRLGGFSLSLGVLILFYTSLIFSEGLARSGEISPFLGGWAANIFFSVVAIIITIPAYKDRPARKL